jgi:hypothetical protein
MRRAAVLPGIGSIAFSVLTLVGFSVANPPGGSYSASDAADYVAKGHHAAVFVSAYLALLAVLGLICLLVYLRDTIRLVPDNERAASIFWGTGLAAAATFAVGWGVVLADSMAHAYGGSGVLVASTVTYLISQVGVVIIFGPGAILLGVALIALMLGSRTTLPAWLRWLTLIAGVAGIASLAYFPFFIVEIWGIVLGVWLLVARPVSASPAVGAQPGA